MALRAGQCFEVAIANVGMAAPGTFASKTDNMGRRFALVDGEGEGDGAKTASIVVGVAGVSHPLSVHPGFGCGTRGKGLQGSVGFATSTGTLHYACSGAGACTINRSCAQQYVGKSQSCMVISGGVGSDSSPLSSPSSSTSTLSAAVVGDSGASSPSSVTDKIKAAKMLHIRWITTHSEEQLAEIFNRLASSEGSGNVVRADIRLRRGRGFGACIYIDNPTCAQ